MFSFLSSLFKRLSGKIKEKQTETLPEPAGSEEPDFSDKLLSPIPHKRYLTCYYIPKELSTGDVEIRDLSGNVISKISEISKARLDMEGTGRLPDGRLVNFADFVSGEIRYKVLNEDLFPWGIGIYNKALVPFCSLAANLPQIKGYDLFDREVIIPNLFSDLGNKIDELPADFCERLKAGRFHIHDTGSAMRSCPYSRGLWRTGDTKREYGQFDVFIGDWKVYNIVKNIWPDYGEVFIMPRNTFSDKGVQETLNLLLDAGLDVDGIIGPLSVAAIKSLQGKAGLPETGKWTELTKKFADLSLENF